MPIIRFKTGDISFIIDEPCPCGQSSIRLGPILGRKKQMLKVKGTTVYPQAVFAVLSEMNYVNDYCIAVSSDENNADQLTVYVALDDTSKVEDIAEIMQARLRVKPTIIIEDEKILKKRVYLPDLRKPVRFFDLRD